MRRSGCIMLRVEAMLESPSALLSWWSGDDHSFDLAGPNHAGLRNGATFSDGQAGRAFHFPVAGAAVHAPAWRLQLGLADFTIVGWLCTTATAPISSLLTFQGTPTALQLVGPTGTLRLDRVSPAPSGGFNDGRYHQFAVTRKSGLIAYHKDGGLLGIVPFGENLGGSRVILGTDTEYRTASQGVALTQSSDTYREGHDVQPNYRIGWCEAGDWFNYIRSFPTPAREYHIYVRMGSAGLPPGRATRRGTAGAAGRCKSGYTSLDALPVALDFGTVDLGQSRELTLTLRNTGALPLTVSALTTDHPAFSLAAP